MNASKENARKANSDLENAARLLDETEMETQERYLIKCCLVRVQNFIESAERKLPTEAAYAKEANRRKVAKK